MFAVDMTGINHSPSAPPEVVSVRNHKRARSVIQELWFLEVLGVENSRGGLVIGLRTTIGAHHVNFCHACRVERKVAAKRLIIFGCFFAAKQRKLIYL